MFTEIFANHGCPKLSRPDCFYAGEGYLLVTLSCDSWIEPPYPAVSLNANYGERGTAGEAARWALLGLIQEGSSEAPVGGSISGRSETQGAGPAGPALAWARALALALA